MKREIERRLIRFSVLIIEITDTLKNSRAGIYLSDQVCRSSISSALNYGESQEAESTKDFIHKLKIVLKELKETSVGLQIIKGSKLSKDLQTLETAIRENDELNAIIYKTIDTTKKNNNLK